MKLKYLLAASVVSLSATAMVAAPAAAQQITSGVEGQVTDTDTIQDVVDRVNNANLGNVINVDENVDLYPGLNLSLKNFGGHVGARYFFSEGFGVFTEANFPLAKYDTDDPIDIHNQFTLNIGAVFNL